MYMKFARYTEESKKNRARFTEIFFLSVDKKQILCKISIEEKIVILFCNEIPAC